MLRFIEGHFYLNCFASAFSEIIGFVLAGILLKFCGFNLALVLSYSLAIGGSCGLLSSFSSSSTTEKYLEIAGLCLVARTGICCAYNILNFSNTRMFPPDV